MTRTTISLPDDLAAMLAREARRLDASVSEVVRQALARHLGGDQTGAGPGFIAIGRSGKKRTARNAEEILAREWANAARRR
jgi:Arc/MetJ-type ribon-helix-helix transcriptional regulator